MPESARVSKGYKGPFETGWNFEFMLVSPREENCPTVIPFLLRDYLVFEFLLQKNSFRWVLNSDPLLPKFLLFVALDQVQS